MKLLRFLSFFGVALAQDNDYLYEATDSPVTQVFLTTDGPDTTQGVFTTDAYTTTATEKLVATEAPAAESLDDIDLSDMGRSNFYAPASTGGRNQATVAGISDLKLALKSNTDFEFTWAYDATHTEYNFEYQVLVGNYQNVTDWTNYASAGIQMATDGVTTTATLSPPADNYVYRFRITPFVNTDAGSPSEIDGQSPTDNVIHQPGDVYNGGGGFAAQILLPTDFANTAYVKTATADTVGYALAVLVTFPSGCPLIEISADVDGSYIYTDPSISDNHRIFFFPETHFSNQFSGPIKAFHYYVSNAAYTGCDVSDPANAVTVSLANGYILRTTEAAQFNVEGMWPADAAYPPVNYVEQHVVNLTDYIQPATHVGPSRALSAPRIYFVTDPCDVTINVEEGTSPGWGFVNSMVSTLDITDLWANAPTSNTGSQFKLQALIWLTQVGIAFRYDTTIVGCETIMSSASITFLEIDPAFGLTTAVNPNPNMG